MCYLADLYRFQTAESQRHTNGELLQHCVDDKLHINASISDTYWSLLQSQQKQYYSDAGVTLNVYL